MTNQILTVIALALSLSLARSATAADPAAKMSDAEITRVLVGRWSENLQIDKISITSVTTFNKDGTFKSEATYLVDNDVKKIVGTGTWKITDHELIETIEASDPPVIEKGKVSRDKILSCSEKMITIKMEDGRESVLKKLDD